MCAYIRDQVTTLHWEEEAYSTGRDTVDINGASALSSFTRLQYMCVYRTKPFPKDCSFYLHAKNETPFDLSSPRPQAAT